jgi:hypothetical protein
MQETASSLQALRIYEPLSDFEQKVPEKYKLQRTCRFDGERGRNG